MSASPSSSPVAASTASRNVDLHPANIAVVLTLNGDVEYLIKCIRCTNFALPKSTLFLPPLVHQPGHITQTEIEVGLFSGSGETWSKIAAAETYHQAGGHAFTILSFEPERDEDDDAILEDTFERFSRYDG